MRIDAQNNKVNIALQVFKDLIMLSRAKDEKTLI